MTTEVAGRYLGAKVAGVLGSERGRRSRLDRAHEWAGARIARTLGDLKGPVMKLGQMASLSSGLLPASLSAPLEVLRRNAPPVAYEVIADQIERELGGFPDELFHSFDQEPYAAASIGQVHRALTKEGRQVAVKVQYPGMDATIEADLAQLRLTFKAIGLVRKRKETFERFFEEVKSHLIEEVDYVKEAENARLLAEFHKERHPFICIPEVVDDLSARRVITLSFKEGVSLDEARRFPRHARDLIAERLVEMVYSQIFNLGALHADPNPANFAFHPDGSFALFDFGCIKRFTSEEQTGLKSVLQGALDRDPEAVDRGLAILGARSTDDPPVDRELLKTLRELVAPALRPTVPFDLETSDVHLKALKLLPSLKRHAASFTLPAGLMLVQRVNVGHYGNLRKLGARVRLRQIIEMNLKGEGGF
jgi:predicted unusual protein kinase regulating ubiquinone biosynthesis (AarF/ABC1/UbiB family)